jgi:hypothetical protein
MANSGSPKRYKRGIKATRTSDVPSYILPYPERITGAYDPNSSNADMRESLTQISDSDSDVQRKLHSRDLIDAEDYDIHGAPTVYATRRDIVLTKLGISPASRNVECRNCGKPKKPSQTKEIRIDVPPFFGRVCKTNCASWNDDGNPEGARRRRN